MSAPDRPTREQVEEALVHADEMADWSAKMDRAVLAAEVRALRAGQDAVLAIADDLDRDAPSRPSAPVLADRLRAALVARNPQPAEPVLTQAGAHAWDAADAVAVQLTRAVAAVLSRCNDEIENRPECSCAGPPDFGDGVFGSHEGDCESQDPPMLHAAEVRDLLTGLTARADFAIPAGTCFHGRIVDAPCESCRAEGVPQLRERIRMNAEWRTLIHNVHRVGDSWHWRCGVAEFRTEECQYDQRTDSREAMLAESLFHLERHHGVTAAVPASAPLPAVPDGEDDDTTAQSRPWAVCMRGLLGKSVEVTLSTEPRVTQTGILHSFTDDGEVCLRDEDGAFRWCWPNLHAVLAHPTGAEQ